MSVRRLIGAVCASTVIASGFAGMTALPASAAEPAANHDHSSSDGTPGTGHPEVMVMTGTHGNQEMTTLDMLKLRTTEQQRLKAAKRARAAGRPPQVAYQANLTKDEVMNQVRAKGPDYFGITPNYASSSMPHITWKGGGDVVLPVFDPSSKTLSNPIDDTPVTPADSPFQIDQSTCAKDPVTGVVLQPIDPTTCTSVMVDPINHVPLLDYSKVSITGGIRKFIEPLPGVGSVSTGTQRNAYLGQSGQTDTGATNPAAAYIPVAVPDTQSYPGSDYYEIHLVNYFQQFSPDLPATKLRGYYQVATGNATGVPGRPFYMGPIINATKDKPVRVKFVNDLPTGQGGELFLPVDMSSMGAGTTPQGYGKALGSLGSGDTYQSNRAQLHLHGGTTPWISDGTPNQWTTPVGDQAKYPKGVSVVGVPDMAPISGTSTVRGHEGEKCSSASSCTSSKTGNDGTMTFYYTNQQSARLLWYHDHTYGITRLNVYAGEAAPYQITDAATDDMLKKVLPADTVGAAAPRNVPLVIQDKGFVPDDTPSGYFPHGQLTDQDPSWKIGMEDHKWQGEGGLWFPHVYMPNQNPDGPDDSGANSVGRWDYGPWFWPVFGRSSGLQNGEIVNPYADGAHPWEPPTIPGTPSTFTKKGTPTPVDKTQKSAKSLSDVSQVPEAFVDTPIVNGVAYPYMNVDPAGYRFQILNASNDRYWNLQMYCSKADLDTIDQKAGKTLDSSISTLPFTGTASQDPMWGNGIAKGDMPTNPETGDVRMVPADRRINFPDGWPTTDSDAGTGAGLPDPAGIAAPWLQFGTDSGVLPELATINQTAAGYNYNRRDIVVLNVQEKSLFLGPAQRADVVYDFSTAAKMGCKNVILYNDIPSPVPAFDVRNDHYTNNPDNTETGGTPGTITGWGPNTRTIMQFRINDTTAVPFDPAPLADALPAIFKATQPKPIVPETAFARAYPGDAIGASNTYSRISSTSMSFNVSSSGEIGSLAVDVAGAGYAPVITVNDPGGNGYGAEIVPVINNGQVTDVKILNGGFGYSDRATFSISQPIGGQAAQLDAITPMGPGGSIEPNNIEIGNGGRGYTDVTPAVTLTGGGGNGALGEAVVDPYTGSLTALTLVQPGAGYTSAPALTIGKPTYVTGATQTCTGFGRNRRCVTTPINGLQATGHAVMGGGAASVKLEMRPKAIQELFEMDYGRMNATMGVELPYTNQLKQTTLPLGYAEPATEFVTPSQVGTQIGSSRDGTQIWKITHNGVDTHAIHFHLMDVQLINRVGWDGAIRPPDANEVGWQDTVRMNPLEDAIVALRPITPELPFKIADSKRSWDPTMPSVNHTMDTFDPLTGLITQFSNDPVDMGWEYVWHCHLLGHEENDMMRVIEYAVSPPIPDTPTATKSSSQATLRWTEPNTTFGNDPIKDIKTKWELTNYVVQRSTNSSFTNNVVETPSTKGGIWQGATKFGGNVPVTSESFTDQLPPNGTTYYYRVRAESQNGYSAWSSAVSVSSSGGGGGGGRPGGGRGGRG